MRRTPPPSLLDVALCSRCRRWVDAREGCDCGESTDAELRQARERAEDAAVARWETEREA